MDVDRQGSPVPLVTSIDLFSGAGGLTAGLRQGLGAIRTVRAVEIDPAAAATFDINHGTGLSFNGHIQDWLDAEEVPEVDLVIGGPPCQGFSSLNRHRVGTDRNALWEKYAETLLRANPRWFVLENVSTFLQSPEFENLQAAARPGGALANWTMSVAVLVASDYGSPQRRRRAVVLGHRRDSPPLNHPAPIDQPSATVRSAFEGLQKGVHSMDLPPRRRTVGARVMPGPFRTDELHVTRSYQPLSKDRFRAIPAGGNRFDLPDALMAPCWRAHKTGSGDVMGRLHWDQPSVTIRTEFFKPEKGRYLHPTEHRAITHHEAARLQGFPDDYLWFGSKAEIARQIGNAVPLQLGKALGLSIAEASALA